MYIYIDTVYILIRIRHDEHPELESENRIGGCKRRTCFRFRQDSVSASCQQPDFVSWAQLVGV